MDQIAKRIHDSFSKCAGMTIKAIRVPTAEECRDLALDSPPWKPYLIIELQGASPKEPGPLLLVLADAEGNGPGHLEIIKRDYVPAMPAAKAPKPRRS